MRPRTVRLAMQMAVELTTSASRRVNGGMGGIMDQPTGNDSETLFAAIVQDVEIRKAAREFDNVDHSAGQNIETPAQVAAASAILAKARELRRILRS